MTQHFLNPVFQILWSILLDHPADSQPPFSSWRYPGLSLELIFSFSTLSQTITYTSFNGMYRRSILNSSTENEWQGDQSQAHPTRCTTASWLERCDWTQGTHWEASVQCFPLYILVFTGLRADSRQRTGKHTVYGKIFINTFLKDNYCKDKQRTGTAQGSIKPNTEQVSTLDSHHLSSP